MIMKIVCVCCACVRACVCACVCVCVCVCKDGNAVRKGGLQTDALDRINQHSASCILA